MENYEVQFPKKEANYDAGRGICLKSNWAQTYDIFRIDFLGLIFLFLKCNFASKEFICGQWKCLIYMTNLANQDLEIWGMGLLKLGFIRTRVCSKSSSCVNKYPNLRSL